jgi:hypothetical protein
MKYIFLAPLASRASRAVYFAGAEAVHIPTQIERYQYRRTDPEGGVVSSDAMRAFLDD